MEKGEIAKENTTKQSPLVLKETSDIMQIGIDIGGSLSKLSVVVPSNEVEPIAYLRNLHKFEEISIYDYKIFIAKFQTPLEKSNVVSTTTIFPLLHEITSKFSIKRVQATGGGAQKFKELADKEFNLEFKINDELISLVNGYSFLNTLSPFYEVQNDRDIHSVPASDLEYPHLAVNIGSGVSIVKLTGTDAIEINRMGGTMMGGGTLTGLGLLLTGLDNYDDLVELASKGDHKIVDLTVKDIYGSEKESDAVAASFGKIPDFINSHSVDTLKKEDIALGLLCMICCHITQLANFLAEKNKVNEILFLGSFTKRNSFAVLCLNMCMKYWNKNRKVRFNHYEGYLGAVGTLVEKRKNE